MKEQSNTLNHIKKLSEGFSKLSPEEREERLIQMGILTEEDIRILNKETALSSHLANHFIENVIGCFPIPLGVAMNFLIDGKNYIIPMAIEETSIIAGVSKTAKWIRENGEITTKTLSRLGVGQIQIPKIKDFNAFNEKILSEKNSFIEMVNKEVAHDIVARGGGVKDIIVRCLPRGDGENMVILHVLVDTCDAMGANTINQVCEYLEPHIETLTNEQCGMCILSNVPDTKLTRAEVLIRNIDPEEGHLIAEGSLFAQIDPFRAATNNKGVMNGIDGILIATGNDWRAVEAGIHAYAGLHGQYTSITRWTMQGNNLHGVIEAPILVGIVGGVTRLHPVAQICLKILNVKNAEELARVIAAVGLVQNLAAIRALVTQGITAGHMKLHLTNLAIASGANNQELPILKDLLADRLAIRKRVTESDVKEILTELRNKKNG